MLNINNELSKPKIKSLLRMCVVFYSSFVCMSAYANVYFKSILRKCLRAGLPSGFLSTAPPPVCVSAVLGTLAVWIPNQKENMYRLCCRSIRSGASGLPYYFKTLFLDVYAVISLFYLTTCVCVCHACTLIYKINVSCIH